MNRLGIGILLIERDSLIQGRNSNEYWEFPTIEAKQCVSIWRRYKAIIQPQYLYKIQDLRYVPNYLKNWILKLSRQVLPH